MIYIEANCWLLFKLNILLGKVGQLNRLRYKWDVHVTSGSSVGTTNHWATANELHQSRTVRRSAGVSPVHSFSWNQSSLRKSTVVKYRKRNSSWKPNTTKPKILQALFFWACSWTEVVNAQTITLLRSSSFLLIYMKPCKISIIISCITDLPLYRPINFKKMSATYPWSVLIGS